MLGAIVGDIVGSRFEFEAIKTKEFELFTDACHVTDDSVMTLAIAKAVLEMEPYFPDIHIENIADVQEALADLATQSMQAFGRNYPDAGYGAMFSRWIQSDFPHPYESYGNGGAMRVSPVAYIGVDKWDTALLADTVTELTHNHEESMKAANAVVMAVAMALEGATKREIKKRMTAQYHPLDFTLDAIRKDYHFSSRSSESVPQAIQCFLESNSFEDAIRNAVSLGGDSDTIASIAGAIAGAYYGVPKHIRDKAMSYLDEYLRHIVEIWGRKFPPNDETFQVLTKYLGKLDLYRGKTWLDDEDYFFFKDERHKMLTDFRDELFTFSKQYFLQDEGPALEEQEEVLDVSLAHTKAVHLLILQQLSQEKLTEQKLRDMLEENVMIPWLKRLKALDWQQHERSIMSVKFNTLDGNHFGLTRELEWEGEKATLWKDCDGDRESPSCQSITYSAFEAEHLQTMCSALHIESWNPVYDQVLTDDGESWQLRVRYSDGYTIHRAGLGHYPHNWDAFVSLLQIKKPGMEEEDN